MRYVCSQEMQHEDKKWRFVDYDPADLLKRGYLSTLLTICAEGNQAEIIATSGFDNPRIECAKILAREAGYAKRQYSH